MKLLKNFGLLWTNIFKLTLLSCLFFFISFFSNQFFSRLDSKSWYLVLEATTSTNCSTTTGHAQNPIAQWINLCLQSFVSFVKTSISHLYFFISVISMHMMRVNSKFPLTGIKLVISGVESTVLPPTTVPEFYSVQHFFRWSLACDFLVKRWSWMFHVKRQF